jgi:hypothetical protein
MHAYGFGFDLEQYEADADDAPEPSSTATSASTSISTSASASGALAGYAYQDDERTPVVSDQPPIPPSSFPTPGTTGKAAVLQSPFRGDTAQAQYHSAEQLQAMSLSHPPAYGYAQPQPYPHTQPQPHTLPAQYFYQPQYIDPNGFSSAVPQYVYPAYANPHDYAHVSPTSSSHSLTRSGSTSSAVRPKVKLTHEDKRRIVELHRTNSSLRQEDIAKQYGCVSPASDAH